MKSGIYRIVNLVNGKSYVGQTFDFDKRKGQHFRALRKGSHRNLHLQNAWNKHGEENFVFEILEEIPLPNNWRDNKLLYRSLFVPREQFWINYYQCTTNDLGYNVSPSAGSTLGMKQSEETKQKWSEMRKGKYPNEDTRKRMSEASKIHRRTDEARQKVSDQMKGNLYNLGRVQTEETRQKISESNMGKVHTEEALKKLTEARCVFRYIVTAPDSVYFVKNMKRFCLFFGLDHKRIASVIKGKRNHHKHCVIRYATEEETLKYEPLLEGKMRVLLEE